MYGNGAPWRVTGEDMEQGDWGQIIIVTLRNLGFILFFMGKPKDFSEGTT